jgi:Cu(I)/Ag(I) efflux system membrane fusion protein
MTIQRTIPLFLAGILLLTLGGISGWWLALRQAPDGGGQAATTRSPETEARKVLYWYDPMVPQQHFDQPGKSPFMDMDLVPKYADAAEDEGQQTTELRIDPVVSESLGIRLASVEQTQSAREIEVSGLLAFNERDVAVVQSRSAGFVERVPPLATGDVVRAGQPLAEILLPEWAAGQEEFLAVRGLNDDNLLKAARERLRLLGLSESQIKRLEKSGRVESRYTLTSPIAGVIQSLEVRNGMNVKNGQTLARINGLDTVWLEVAVPEAESDLARVGNRAKVKLNGLDDPSLEAIVGTVLPALNGSSRSIRVRIELDNPGYGLRPGQSAQVRLSGGQHKLLTVPTEALIRTGKRTLVMLAAGEGRYTPVEVRPGDEIGDRTQIVAGLVQGQQVVASGQFLIDSEASLNGIEARALPTTMPKPEHKQHEHHEHQHMKMDAMP